MILGLCCGIVCVMVLRHCEVNKESVMLMLRYEEYSTLSLRPSILRRLSTQIAPAAVGVCVHTRCIGQTFFPVVCISRL